MIDAKQAAIAAIAYFQDVMGSEKITDILLEEIELTEDERLWLVTLSGLIPKAKEELEVDNLSAIAAIMRPLSRWRRVYRMFKLDAANGLVKSMKMRQPDERSN